MPNLLLWQSEVILMPLPSGDSRQYMCSRPHKEKKTAYPLTQESVLKFNSSFKMRAADHSSATK